MSKRVSIEVGYTKNGPQWPAYKWWTRQNLQGVDIKVTDGAGNVIQLNARENELSGAPGVAFRIWVNDKEIRIGEGD